MSKSSDGKEPTAAPRANSARRIAYAKEFASKGRIRRARIHERLRSAASAAITLVVAPAGFGKTTAIRDWLAETQNSLYLSVSRPVTLKQFVIELARGLSVPYPELESPREKPPAGTPASEPNLERYLAWARFHLHDVGFTIAIDDLQNAESGPGVASFVVRLVDATKHHVRWILSSRSAGMLPVTRWLAYGDANGVIDADELRLTFDEALTLSNSLNSPVTNDELEQLLKQTNGYVVPISYALRSSASQGSFHAIMDDARSLTFDFLAQELWSQLDDADKTLLEVAAILPPLHVHAYELGGITGASQSIAQLNAKIAFINLDDDAFTMHDMFREFVLQQTLISPRQLEKRRKTALHVLGQGKFFDLAFRLLVSIGSIEQLLWFSEAYSAPITDPSLVGDVVEALAAVDPARLPTALLRLKTDYLASFIDPQLSYLAELLFERSDCTSSDLLCAVRSAARASHSLSDIDRAMWIERISEALGKLEPGHRIQCSAYQAFFLSLEPGKQLAASELLTHLHKSVNKLPAVARVEVYRAMTTSYFYLGNNREALQAARDAVAAAKASGDSRLRAQTLNNLGLSLFHSDDAAIENLFSDAHDVVQRTGSWRFSQVSHYLPALFFALKGNEQAARLAITLQQTAISEDAFVDRNLPSISRHCANLCNLLAGNNNAVTADYLHRPAPEKSVNAYVILTDAAIAFTSLADFESGEKALNDAKRMREKLNSVEIHAVRHAIICEIICLSAQGRWVSAKRLLQIQVELGLVTNPALKEALTILCSGPPFRRMVEQVDLCVGQPYVGFSAWLLKRLIRVMPDSSSQVSLTAAQTDVLRLLASGKSNKEIAVSRARSVETIKRQVAATYQKLGADNRTSAVAIAKDLRLI